MTIQDLLDTLSAQAENGQITLDTSILSSEEVTNMQQAFGLASTDFLTLTNVTNQDITQPAGETILINAGTLTLFNAVAADIQLTFTLGDSGVELLLQCSMEDDWSLVESFPALDCFPFNATNSPFANNLFVYTSATASSFTPAFEAYADSSLELRIGLNYFNVTSLGDIPVLGALLSAYELPTDIVFGGTFSGTLTNGFPSFDLTCPLLTEVTILPGITFPEVDLRAVTQLDTEGNGSCSFGLSTETTDMSYFIELDESVTFVTFTVQGIEGMLPSLADLTNSDLVNTILPSGTDFSSFLPDSLADIFEAIQFQGATFTYNITDGSFDHICFAIGQDPNSPISIIGISFNDLVLQAQWNQNEDQSGLTAQIDFVGTASIGMVVFQDPFSFTLSASDASGSWELTEVTGAYEGTIKLVDVIAEVDSEVTVPEMFNEISFSEASIEASPRDATYTIHLSIEVALGFINASLDSLVNLDISQDDSGTTTFELSGDFNINSDNQFTFEVTLGEESSIQGSWANGDNPLGLSDIASAFGLLMPAVPSGLDLSLVAADLKYDFTNSVLVLEAASLNYGNAVFAAYQYPEWAFYFGLSVGEAINLSDLPLVNQVLPEEDTIAIEDLQILLTSAVLDPSNDQEEIDLINGFIEGGYPTIPDEGLISTAALSAQFDFGGLVYPISIATPATSSAATEATDSADDSTSSGTVIGETSGENQGTIPPPTESADGTTWFDIQKSFGPVNFEKIGFKYQDSMLWFLINASLEAAGLEISLEGLSVATPFDTFSPQFNIEGLGVAYSNTAVTISGAFEEVAPVDPVTLDFSGEVTISLDNVGISAIGSYAQINGQTSLFIFADVSGTFGGPGFFSVKGFSGGFGFNSTLRIPGQDEIDQFPFLASLSDDTVFGEDPSPTAVLETISGGEDPWVTPSVGDIWVGLGVQFTTYEIVASNAVITAEFGNSFLLALLGISTGQFPKEGSTTYAYIELELEAVFDPTDGLLSFSATLSPNSYLLDPSCQLTGGFALYFWYDPNAHSGDFVLTLGGYSPYYTPPSYYPSEPQVGFNWAIDDATSITGGLYFALTPAAVMAGGSLSVTYDSGCIKAWFDIYTDIVIWYNPFHFVADIGVDLGASVTVDLFGASTTISVDVGADLTLWGPATGGTVTVHLWIISFTIDFGADESSGQDKQSWSDFIQVLPAAENVVKHQVVTGLLAGAAPASGEGSQTTSTSDQPWVVRADAFEFTSEASIPLTELYIAGDDSFNKDGSGLNIKPMQETDLTSTMTLSIISEETQDDVLNDSWYIEYLYKSLPSALWGTGSSTELPDGDQLIADQLTGFRIKVPPPTLGASTGDIDLKWLQYDPLDPGICPLTLNLDPQGEQPSTSEQTIDEIEQIMSKAILAERDAIYGSFESLGLTGLNNASLNDLATHANALFVDEPLLTES